MQTNTRKNAREIHCRPGRGRNKQTGQPLIDEMHVTLDPLNKTNGVALTGARAARYLQEVPLEPPSPFCSRIEGLGMVFVMVRGRPVKSEKIVLGGPLKTKRMRLLSL